MGRELYIIWRFINNDIWDTVIPCLLTFTTAWIYHKKGLDHFALQFFLSFLYTILYILTFCIANQIYSIEEDKINKPYRPLPQGLVTVKETQYRMVIYNIGFLLIAWPLHILWLAIAWQIVTFMLCKWGFSDHWFTKNPVCITLGTITLLAAEWRIVDVWDKGVWAYIIVLSLWAGFGLPLQDMRDQVGDRLMGRKTLPLAIGDTNARWALSIYFFTVSPLIYLCFVLTQVSFAELTMNITALIVILVEVLWHWYIGIRLWVYKSPKEDDNTYHWFVYLFCVTIPIICFI